MASRDEVPPPLQDLPDAKTRKYDRQLRLWGANGQVALEEAHVLLINNGPGVTGVETLKNLVLPGIGSFTIADAAVVSEADLGVNFFLEESSLGKPRAEETCKFLKELNPDVHGYAITEPLESWAFQSHGQPGEDRPNWVIQDAAFKPYTLVLIAAPIDAKPLQTIADHLYEHSIPTFYIHCMGYYSCFALALPRNFPVVDTHPDQTTTTDLRLLKPWPALAEFAQKKTTTMDQMNGEEFAHIPWICLLLHYLSIWREKNDGNAPESYKEKTSFRELVRSGSANEENFDEACAAVLKSLNPPTAPSSVRDIFAAPETTQLSATSPPFWVIANAVSQFYTKHGQLPLPGAVPDMKARSDTYIQLQSLYKTKAREDAAEVIATVRALEKDTGRSSSIDETEIVNFCKGAAHVALVSGSPLASLRSEAWCKNFVAQARDRERMAGLYIAFAAVDRLQAIAKSSPDPDPATDYSPDGAAAGLVLEAFSILSDIRRLAGAGEFTDRGAAEEASWRPIKEDIDDACVELQRARGGELHNVASLAGGLVAQEAIKVVTKQYVPISTVCLYDGVASRMGVLRL